MVGFKNLNNPTAETAGCEADTAFGNLRFSNFPFHSVSLRQERRE